MKCPNCLSEEVQHARVVYENGTASLGGVATSTGIGYTPGVGATVSTGVTRMRGLQSSLTAQRTAPPTPPSPTSCWWLGSTIALGLISLQHLLYLPTVIGVLMEKPGTGFGYLLAWIFWAALLSGGIWALLRHRARIERQKEEYPGLYAAWSKSWLCHKCGYFGPLD